METRVFSVSFGEASLFFSRVKRREEKINKIKHRNDTKVLSIYIYLYILWNVRVIEQCIKNIYIFTRVRRKISGRRERILDRAFIISDHRISSRCIENYATFGKSRI